VSFTATRSNLGSLAFVNVLATLVPIHVFAIFVIYVFNGNGGVRDFVINLQHLFGFLEDEHGLFGPDVAGQGYSVTRYAPDV